MMMMMMMIKVTSAFFVHVFRAAPSEPTYFAKQPFYTKYDANPLYFPHEPKNVQLHAYLEKSVFFPLAVVMYPYTTAAFFIDILKRKNYDMP